MTIPTWHLERAKAVLEEWYDKAEKLIHYAELAISIYPTKSNHKAANQYKRRSLHCKTAGLVWHDRYKLLLEGGWRNPK
jgi:hypothetical protein